MKGLKGYDTFFKHVYTFQWVFPDQSCYFFNEKKMNSGNDEEKVCCRYEGDHSQRHLEGSKLNQVLRRGWGSERGREERIPGVPETQRPRDKEPGIAKMAGLCRTQRS